mmetsp:Transcript_8957/g.23095  ORF Transcript_8957/g.23095 Transcript_8957/m.23095 type:complete len:264 (+) Transcript_8957:289-1080(+)
MDTDELREIFDEIDTSDNGIIETGELHDFFTKAIGSLGPMFQSLVEVNKHLATVLQTTAAVPVSEKQKAFITRFFLKEMVIALGSLQGPLRDAVDAMTTAAQNERPNVIPDQETIDLGPMASPAASGGGGAVAKQVDRLAVLVDKLSGIVGVSLHVGTIEEAKGAPCALASLHFDVAKEETFKNALKVYLGQVVYTKGCIRAQAYEDGEVTILYLVYSSAEDFKLHLRSEGFRTLNRVCADALNRPIDVKSMETPRAWWITEK